MPPALVQHYYAPFALVPHFWLMFAFFAVLTLMLVTAVVVGQNRKGAMGAQVFLIFTTLKLLVCMGFALYFITSFRVKSTPFLTGFFYIYLFYTVFEVYILISNLRLQNKK